MVLTDVQLGWVENIKPLIKPNAEGIDTVATAFEATLPENDPVLNMEAIKRMQDHIQAFVPAAVQAIGEVGIETMKTNKELSAVEINMPIGNDALNTYVKRQQEYPAAPGSDEKITKYGIVRPEYQTNATKRTGALGKVLKNIGAAAAEALA